MISEKSKTMMPLSLKVPLTVFLLHHIASWLVKRERNWKHVVFAAHCAHLHLPPSKGKRRIAHRPNSKPKLDAVLDLKEEDEEGNDGGGRKGILTEEELWARLDELEKLEALQDEQDR